MVSIVAGLVLLVIAVIVFLVAGTQISAFVNDTLGAFGVASREGDIRIPTPQQGQITCNMFVTAKWEVRLSTQIFSVVPILFFDPNDVAGVGIDTSFQDCKISSGSILSFLPLFDFLSTSDQVQPLDLFIPIQSAFEEPYELSWVLVQTDTGKERKVRTYQDIEYIVPSLNFDFRHEQKLVFRDVVPDDYTLKIIPLKARFADLDDGQPLLEFIPDPTQ